MRSQRYRKGPDLAAQKRARGSRVSQLNEGQNLEWNPTAAVITFTPGWHLIWAHVFRSWMLKTFLSCMLGPLLTRIYISGIFFYTSTENPVPFADNVKRPHVFAPSALGSMLQITALDLRSRNSLVISWPMKFWPIRIVWSLLYIAFPPAPSTSENSQFPINPRFGYWSYNNALPLILRIMLACKSPDLANISDRCIGRFVFERAS